MTTIHAPINDKFESILADLVSNIIEGWDIKTCVSFCQENLQKKWKAFSIEELVQQYEIHHDRSIVSTVIDWKDHLTTGEPNWSNFTKAECHPVKISGINSVKRVDLDDDDIDFWSVYLVDQGGLSFCILDLQTQVEAEVITRSINTYYLAQDSE